MREDYFARLVLRNSSALLPIPFVEEELPIQLQFRPYECAHSYSDEERCSWLLRTFYWQTSCALSLVVIPSLLFTDLLCHLHLWMGGKHVANADLREDVAGIGRVMFQLAS